MCYHLPPIRDVSLSHASVEQGQKQWESEKYLNAFACECVCPEHFKLLFVATLIYLHLNVCIQQTLLSKATYSAFNTFYLSMCVFSGD